MDRRTAADRAYGKVVETGSIFRRGPTMSLGADLKQVHGFRLPLRAILDYPIVFRRRKGFFPECEAIMTDG